jgi:hypothetical protein
MPQWQAQGHRNFVNLILPLAACIDAVLTFAWAIVMGIGPIPLWRDDRVVLEV